MPLRDTVSHLGDKGSSHERQMERRVMEQTEGMERVMTEKREIKNQKSEIKKPKTIRFKVLTDSAVISPINPAFKGIHDCNSGQCVSPARVA